MLSRLREFRRARDEYGDMQARWMVPGGHVLDVAARVVPFLVVIALTVLFTTVLIAVVR